MSYGLSAERPFKSLESRKKNKNLNFTENVNESRSGFSPWSLTAALNGTEADEPRRALRVQSKTWNKLTRDWAAANIYQQYRLPLRLLFSAPGAAAEMKASITRRWFLLGCVIQKWLQPVWDCCSRPSHHNTTQHSTTQHNTPFGLGDPPPPDLWRNRRLTCTHISVI